MSLRAAVRRVEFFVLGSALIVLGVLAYLFDRTAFDFNFVFCGLCALAIGVLERSREKASLRGKSKA